MFYQHLLWYFSSFSTSSVWHYSSKAKIYPATATTQQFYTIYLEQTQQPSLALSSFSYKTLEHVNMLPLRYPFAWTFKGEYPKDRKECFEWSDNMLRQHYSPQNIYPCCDGPTLVPFYLGQKDIKFESLLVHRNDRNHCFCCGSYCHVDQEKGNRLTR